MPAPHGNHHHHAHDHGHHHAPASFGKAFAIGTAVAGLGARFHIGHATLQVETMSVAAFCRLRSAEVT